MSASDGYIVGVTKVVDHGPEDARWDLVIVGDGYRASELSNYHTHVQNFINDSGPRRRSTSSSAASTCIASMSSRPTAAPMTRDVAATRR